MTRDVDLEDIDDDAPFAQTEEALAQGNLTVRQVRALAVKHAAPDKSNVQLARLAGVPLRTLQFWIAQPFFSELWSDANRRHQRVVQELHAEGEIVWLRRLITVQNQPFEVVPASVQVDAAAKGLTAVQRKREHETVSAGQWLAQGKWTEMAAESKEMLKEAVEGEVVRGDDGAGVGGDGVDGVGSSE